MTTEKPRLQLSETGLNEISIIADFPSVDPRQLFDFWIEPGLLKKWWPPEVDLQPMVGGSFHFSWPKQEWHLRGRFTEFDSGRRLGFSWTWDHDPKDTTEVKISFEPLKGGGTRILLYHGSYALTEEGKKTRDGHVEGWMYFLGKLQEQDITAKK